MNQDELKGSLTEEERSILLAAAEEAREKAYAPYSHFAVGAAVLTKDGEVYQGCNIENASYSLTICAERAAIFQAVSQGKKDFKALAVCAATDQPVSPCGACRQVLAEFKVPVIMMANRDGNYRLAALKNLLPYAFDAVDLSE